MKNLTRSLIMKLFHTNYSGIDEDQGIERLEESHPSSVLPRADVGISEGYERTPSASFL